MALLSAITAISMMSGTSVYVFAEHTEEQKVELNYKRLYMVPGMKTKLKLKNAQGKIIWTSSRSSIVKVNRQGMLTAKKIGQAIITAKNQNHQYKSKIYVQNKKAYMKSFIKEWVQYVDQKKSPYEKALTASYYVMTSFAYGNHYNAEDLLATGNGTCKAGSDLVARLCNAMGIKAKVRFAAKDPMSRYPSNITFASQHYNVQLTIKGKRYYVDGNPGSMFMYLSSTKKPLYSANWILGSYIVDIDQLPK